MTWHVTLLCHLHAIHRQRLLGCDEDKFFPQTDPMMHSWSDTSASKHGQSVPRLTVMKNLQPFEVHP